MGELDDIDFGADTDAIRKWLAKRATYAEDSGDPVRGGKHRVDPPGTIDPQQLSVPDARDAAQNVLDALAEPAPPVASRWPTAYKPVPKAPAPTGDASTAAKVPANPPPRPGHLPGVPSPYASTPEREEALTSSRSTNAVFAPRLATRRFITALFVGTAALTAAAGYFAYEERTSASYGWAILLGVLTLIVWGVRATTSVTELAVIHGQLEMIRNGKFEVVDLASAYTPVLVESRPGRRGWKVLVERHGQPLLVIDASIVDPYHFTAVLQRIRPELRLSTATARP